jgi:hypothetical protein
MKRLHCFGLLPLITVLVWGQSTPQAKPTVLPNRSDALVNSLYEQVVARHPLGIPYGADMKVFAPYLSKTLLHRFDLNNACFADWRKQNPDPSLKPPIGLIENGLFSGGNEEAEPQAFHVERIEAGKEGSSRVYVKLTLGDPPDKPLVWYVAVVVVREKGRPVVDDVLYLKDKNGEVESRLSKDLSSGCDGARWVGETPHPAR